MNIVAGEPAPPGFENEVKAVAYIQPKIDAYKANALLGIEYTLELHEEFQREPFLYCLLCDKRGDPRSIIHHWASYNHRMKYLEKHFPTVAKELKVYKYKQNSYKKVIFLLQAVAEAIEDHHGRLKPSVYSADQFRRMKQKIFEEINQQFHYDEQNGPNFVDVINKEEANNPGKNAPKRGSDQISDNYNRDLDEISSDEDIHDGPKKPKKQEPSPNQKNLPRVRRSPPFEEERNSRNPINPKDLSMEASQIAQEKYKWEQYRNMLEVTIKRMNSLQDDYDRNPEKHPSYSKEWIQFWNKRYKELQIEKKVNPNKYDYKPEWVGFWSKRMKELYNEEVEKAKKELKLKLNLPEDDDDETDKYNAKHKTPLKNNGHNMNNRNSNRDKPLSDVIDISDDEENDHISRRRKGSRSKSGSLSMSPPVRRHYAEHDRVRESDANYKSKYGRIETVGESPHGELYERSRRGGMYPPTRGYAREREYFMEQTSTYPRPMPGHPHYARPSHYRVMDPQHIPSYERSPTPNKGKKEEDDDAADNEPLTVVAVLRLLTALEEHLGSLGPKAVGLLGKALALEKVKANSSEDLLLNEDNCVFFETLKEKLKGLLIAKVIDDPQKVKTVKKTIKNIAAIVHQANAKGAEETTKNDSFSSKNDSMNKKENAVINIKDLPFDRQLIATKLAASLVNAGRDDVSTDEMDKLIFFFILMTKLSKEKRSYGGGPLSMSDIRYELGLPKVDEFVPSKQNDSPEEDLSMDKSDKDSKDDAGASMLESLTDSDLQTLLQNFKHLSSEEQHHLIAHLKKLETADPTRVEKLRKFVNVAQLDSGNNTNESPRSYGGFDDDEEMFDRRNNKKAPGTFNANKFSLDDDEEDDDYNFDELCKAAANKASTESRQLDAGPSRKEPIVPVSSSPTALTFNRAVFSSSAGPTDSQNLIANLMGTVKQNNSNQGSNHGPGQMEPRAVPPVNAQQMRTMPQPIPPPQNLQPVPPPHQPHPQQMQNYNPQMGGPPMNMEQYPYQGPPQNNPMMHGQPNMYYNNMGGYDNSGAYPPQWNQGPPMNYNMPYNQMGYGYGGN